MKVLRCFVVGLFAAALGLASARAGNVRALPGHLPPTAALSQPLGRLPATNSLRLAIGLPLRNREALTNLLHQLYDPASPRFHHFLNSREFTDAFGPTEQDYQAVMDFARSNHLAITTTFSNRAVLEVRGSVSDIEKAFRVNLRLFRHPTEQRNFYAPDVEPSLDSDIPALYIGGLSNYRLPHPASIHVAPFVRGQGVSPAAGSVSGLYVGLDLRNAYAAGIANTGAGQSVGLVEFDSYYSSDVQKYLSLAQTGLSGVSVTLSNVILGGLTGPPGDGNTEVVLDIDMAISMAPGLPTIYVYEAPNDANTSPDLIMNRIASDDLSEQISCSWTGFDDPTVEDDYLTFAMQGQSFFQASGDSGAYNRFSNPIEPPADNPNLTIVGGTTLSTTGPKGSWVSETTWSWFTTPFDGLSNAATSGGISTTWAIPSWQQGIITTASHGSSQARNIPDVAMVANQLFLYADDGAQLVAGGTSAAAPLWAGLTALINQQRAAQAQPPQGFMNPALYAVAESSSYGFCFHDTTVGNNTNLDSPTLFPAVTGYDLCTGIGTPKGLNLLDTLAPEPLQITPSTLFTFSGPFHGPFSPASQNLTLTNVAVSSFNWTLGASSPWLATSSSSGTLASGGTAAIVTISPNTAASNLTVGNYTNFIRFTNVNDKVSQTREFVLTVTKATPSVVWTSPASIVYGTALSSTQLGATASVPGTFTYSPTNGSVLYAGTNTLTVVFTPTDMADYTSVTDTVSQVVLPAPLTVTAADASRAFAQPNPPFQGVIAGVQNGDNITAAYSCIATDSSPAGTYPIVPTLIDPANLETNYTVTLVNGTLTVTQATMVAITWTNPAPIIYGTTLSSTQLDATASVPGMFTYSPTNGSVLFTGTNVLTVVFTPTDTVDYTGATDTVSQVVSPAPLNVTAADASRAFGQPNPPFQGVITGLQNGDNITAAYSCIATDSSPAGTYPIVPTLIDPANLETNYTVNLVNGTLTVTQATMVAITWTNPAPIIYGTTLSSTQLDATASVPGMFTYSPTNGSVLFTGTNVLTVIFTPTDTVDYTEATDTVSQVVLPAPLTVTAADASRAFAQPNPPFQGVITGLQNGDNITATYSCTATDSSLAGTYPIVPTLIDPADLETNYTVNLINGTLTVTQAMVTISWANPDPIGYPTPLSDTQLDAIANVPGSFAYSPSLGAILNPGTNILTAVFTPTDTLDFSDATNTVSLVVTGTAPPIIQDTDVPLLPPWGLAIMLAGMAAFGVRFLARRESATG